ncbi:hypothetical protein SAMD00019534_111400 [Acytostelium subglobosum LB1]|uniref:hypothetical protein n=1 Tax=Acytostelium subglobosum LB1 TaxID=1410327 RepID=UPI000645221B|nr:hypothetical protein SAMD00019534_111400 [Acytostelium subglobosum LB1]GAM27964.1 hypothetical protein SAMD00019534_111400 [Acytostelium subglobosum LB1]|eukprot:XP_012749247.1 hypothetical protein SAMD00019534_111400 [Acytostelium subglobosum LB1]
MESTYDNDIKQKAMSSLKTDDDAFLMVNLIKLGGLQKHFEASLPNSAKDAESLTDRELSELRRICRAESLKRKRLEEDSTDSSLSQAGEDDPSGRSSLSILNKISRISIN